MTIIFLLVLLVFVIWLGFKINTLADQLSRAERRLEDLERAFEDEQRQQERAPVTAPVAPPPLSQGALEEARGEAARDEKVAPAVTPVPVAPVAPLAEIPPIIASVSVQGTDRAEPCEPATSPSGFQLGFPKSLNWEQFLGVKLFAWIGGLVLFLFAAFLIKHAFDNGWIRPEIRVAAGYVVGLGLVAGGLRLARERYAVTVETLCAAGTLILYANIYTSSHFYKLISEAPAFGLMALVTAMAFGLAVRLDAQVVAILGLLGGFLTPPLLSTGVDKPLELFGYIALLDIGLLAIALRKRWNHLGFLAAVATVVMQTLWVNRFFTAEKIHVALGIFLGFTILFVAAFAAAHRLKAAAIGTDAAALLLPSAALFFVWYLFLHPYPTLAERVLLVFGFVLLVDLGLLVVAWLREDLELSLHAAAISTGIIQASWVLQFFTAEKVYIGLGIFLGFAAVFLAVFVVTHRLKAGAKWGGGAVLFLLSAALAFVMYVLLRPYPELAGRAQLLFGFVFLVDLGFVVVAWLREDLRLTLAGAGGGVFVLLTLWTVQFLTPALLNTALGLFLLFAVLHSVLPVVLQQRRPTSTPLWWIHCWPPLVLLLMLSPILQLAEPSLLIWPVVLLIDLLAIALAVLTASLVAILTVFVLTMFATALWLIKLPPLLTEVPGMLLVIGGFAFFFMMAGIFAARKVAAKREGGAGLDAAFPLGPSAGAALSPEQFTQIVSLGSMLPFLLLTMMVLRLPLTNPSPVFGLAALLAVLLLGVVRLCKVDLVALVTLGSVLFLECAWHFQHFAPEQVVLATGWYLGFSAVFLVFPFLFQPALEERVIPWMVSALALPLHFFLLYRAIKLGYPDFAYAGLVPAALAAPCFAGLLRLARTLPAESRNRNALLALFGGATLFFITLVFPIQFERQWLTIGWALEGAALLWLFHRVPHPGLRQVGVALLLVAFVRLALNPAVLEYHPRTGTPILNWFLYAYGIVTICLLAGARLLAPPRHLIRAWNVPPVLYTLGTILAFLLLNIEIADYFSTGAHLTFKFSGNFGQDMTYSLGWALFAFVLLAVGFKVNNAATRYAGMGLLVVTIIKLFLHDLFRLGGLYRVGALGGLAVVLIVVSFVYQRFLSSAAVKKERPGTQSPGA